MIENSATKFHLITQNKTYEAPYCDTFVVYQEVLVLSPPPESQPVIKSSVYRSSYWQNFVKSTMMRGIISRATDSESKAAAKDFVEKFIVAKGRLFLEKKKPVPKIAANQLRGKGSLKIESSKTLQAMVNKKAQIVKEQKQKLEQAEK